MALEGGAGRFNNERSEHFLSSCFFTLELGWGASNPQLVFQERPCKGYHTYVMYRVQSRSLEELFFCEQEQG